MPEFTKRKEDAFALVTATAHKDDWAIRWVLDQADSRDVAEFLATWVVELLHHNCTWVPVIEQLRMRTPERYGREEA